MLLFDSNILYGFFLGGACLTILKVYGCHNGILQICKEDKKPCRIWKSLNHEAEATYVICIFSILYKDRIDLIFLYSPVITCLLITHWCKFVCGTIFNWGNQFQSLVFLLLLIWNNNICYKGNNELTCSNINVGVHFGNGTPLWLSNGKP